MSNYKFGFVLSNNEDSSKRYIMKEDIDNMSYITDNEMNNWKISFDKTGRVYIEEDVNMSKSDKFLSALKEHGHNVDYVSVVKWKEFPVLN